MRKTNRPITRAELDRELEQAYAECRTELDTCGRVASFTFYRLYGMTFTRYLAETGDEEAKGWLRALNTGVT